MRAFREPSSHRFSTSPIEESLDPVVGVDLDAHLHQALAELWRQDGAQPSRGPIGLGVVVHLDDPQAPLVEVRTEDHVGVEVPSVTGEMKNVTTHVISVRRVEKNNHPWTWG